MIEKLRNRLNVPLIDRDGQLVEHRDYVNVPYAEMFSDPIAIIDWKTNGEDKPFVEELSRPIFYNGVEFHGDYAWGSAVKRGQTMGLTKDVGRQFGFVKSTEDGQRVQRWLLAQGLNGGFKASELRVKIVQLGTSVNGYILEDGNDLIDYSLYQDYVSGDLVNLGGARESYTVWQRIPFSEALWNEFAPKVDDLIHALGNPTSFHYINSYSSFNEKKELVALDTAMTEHPFVANALVRSCAAMYLQACTSLPTGGVFKVAIPSAAPKVVWAGHEGKGTCHRFPVDSNSSIQALEFSTSKDEQERIANAIIGQHTIACDEFFDKGCFTPVKDLGYDLVICSENIKMSKKDLKEIRKTGEMTIHNVIMPFIMVYEKGSAVGVNAKWAKDLLGLDFDGDMLCLVDCDDKPVYWQAVKDLKPGKTPKLPKEKTAITETSRASMIFKSMSNLVGFASNVASMSFVIKDREALALRLGFKSEEALNNTLNYFIKCGTDGFKTSIDLVTVEKQVAALQNNLQQIVGGAPWTVWGHHPDMFTRRVPEFAFINENNVYCHEDGTIMTKDEAKVAIKPHMDGTIAQIAKRMLPAIQQLLDTPIKTRPLSAFRKWAFDVSKEEYEAAQSIVLFHNARVKRVNWLDPESIANYKRLLGFEIEAWLASGIDRKRAACALWQVVHSSRSMDSGASCVFLAFPEEAKWIVENKPGLSGGFNTVLTGLNFQLPGCTHLDVDVEIVDVTVSKAGKTLIRKAVVAQVQGQKQPGSDYPRNMIAMVAVNADQPENGNYHAIINQISTGAWSCQLV